MKFSSLYFYSKVQVSTLDKTNTGSKHNTCKYKATLRIHQHTTHFITELQLCPHTKSVPSPSLKGKKNNLKHSYFNISSTKKEIPHQEKSVRCRKKLLSSDELINH